MQGKSSRFPLPMRSDADSRKDTSPLTEVEVNLHKKVRLAIGVNDEFVEKTVEGIIAGARTGYIGDGKIFVLPMEECIRIRTGERGRDAIG